MTWLGVILLVCGLALRFALHAAAAHWAGIALAAVGGLLIVTGLVRTALRLRRRIRGGGLRYAEREEHPDGIPADYRTGRGKIFAMVIVLIYLFSPIDLAVLELLLPVGVVGDTGAVAWLLVATGTEVSRHRQARQARRALAAGRVQERFPGRSGPG